MSPTEKTNRKLLWAAVALLSVNFIISLASMFTVDSGSTAATDAKDAAEESRDLVASVVNPEAIKMQNLQLICFLQAIELQRALQFNEAILEPAGYATLPENKLEERCDVFEFAKYIEELRQNGLHSG